MTTATKQRENLKRINVKLNQLDAIDSEFQNLNLDALSEKVDADFATRSPNKDLDALGAEIEAGFKALNGEP